MVDPLFVERDGHRTWIKWHRARRRGSDPVFLGRRVIEGMRLGASVEVDLVVHGGQGFAILHDLTLDSETTGGGAVRDAAPEALRELHLRGNDGVPLPDTVMLLEDLCALLRTEPAHKDALLQLDYKEDMAALGQGAIANFAAAVTPVARNMIVSGADMAAIDALAAATPGLRTGYDPCDGEPLARLRATGDFARFIGEALETAPGAGMIYLNFELVLAAEANGFDIVAPVHAAGRRVDAWTIKTIDADSLKSIERLLALKVDQITTDDPEGLATALAS
jgi:glycerophosphoryl diester phosphodiesterase